MSQNKWRLDGRKVVVTGGTKGIGKATADAFLQLGAEVIITARNAEAVGTCVDQWKTAGLAAHGFVGDAANQHDREALYRFVKERGDSLDVLVNNVGTNIRKVAMDYTDEDVATIFNTNLSSAFGLCRLFYPMLKAAKDGFTPAGSVRVRSPDNESSHSTC